MKRPQPYLNQFTQQWAPPDPDHSGNEHLRDTTTCNLLWYLGWAHLDACWAYWVETDPDADRWMQEYPHLRRKPSTAAGGPAGIFPYDDCVLDATGQITHWGIGTYHDYPDSDQDLARYRPQATIHPQVRDLLKGLDS